VLFQAAMVSFLIEFSKFEMQSVATALRTLSKDPVFVDESHRLLNLDSRLTLLERLAFARAVPPTLMAELKEVMARARRLHQHRDAVAANLVAVTPIKPAVVRVEEYASEAVALQKTLQALTDRLDAGQPPDTA
jgi:hypothetical protein